MAVERMETCEDSRSGGDARGQSVGLQIARPAPPQLVAAAPIPPRRSLLRLFAIRVRGAPFHAIRIAVERAMQIANPLVGGEVCGNPLFRKNC